MANIFVRLSSGNYGVYIDGKLHTARRKRPLRRLLDKRDAWPPMLSKLRTVALNRSLSYLPHPTVFARGSYDYTNPDAYPRKNVRRHG